MDNSFFEVRSLPEMSRPFLTEQDAVEKACRHLSNSMRSRPTMPPEPGDSNSSCMDVESGAHLPLWHCAFKGCAWWGADEKELHQHLASDARHQEHLAACRKTSEFTQVFSDVDLYEQAIKLLEQEQVPLVGPSVDRRGSCSEITTTARFEAWCVSSVAKGRHRLLVRTQTSSDAILGGSTASGSTRWKQI